MNKETFASPKAPKPIGPYSPAVRTGLVVFLSGQIGVDPKTGDLAGPDVETQARRAFANLAASAEAAGGSLANAVKMTLFLVDMAHFPVVNQVMSEMVPAPYPARTTIAVAALPKGALFEVEAFLVL